MKNKRLEKLTPEQRAFLEEPTPKINNVVGLARLLTLAMGLSMIPMEKVRRDEKGNEHLPEGSGEALAEYAGSRRSDSVAEALLASGVEFGTMESEPQEILIVENEDEDEKEIESDFELVAAIAADIELATIEG